MNNFIFFIKLSFVCVFISSCLYDKFDIEEAQTDYPKDIEHIMLTRCATGGCHNPESKSKAAGLDLSTWDRMFDGAKHGAVTIPYSTLYSTLLYYTNTDSAEGVVAFPSMPTDGATLSKEEYYILRDWIAKGAPAANNTVKFSDDYGRKKLYIANRGCNNVAVYDVEKRVIMRYKDLGTAPGATASEAPQMIKVTPDNKLWITTFSGSSVMQVFDAATDELKFSIPVDTGSWSTFSISSDSRRAYTCNYNSGKVNVVDLDAGTIISSFTVNDSIHGIDLNSTNDTLYIGLNVSSGVMYKVPVNNPYSYQTVHLYGTGANIFLKPHEIKFRPDYKYYFVTCEGPGDDEVCVYKADYDHLEKEIHVGNNPSQMAMSAKNGLLFVTCMGDQYFPGITGSVSVIDMQTFQEIKRIQVGWQPYALVVDDEAGLVYVANRNFQGTGTMPFHPSACNGRNGNLSIIDITTLEAKPDIYTEFSVDPFGMAIRY